MWGLGTVLKVLPSMHSGYTAIKKNFKQIRNSKGGEKLISYRTLSKKQIKKQMEVSGSGVGFIGVYQSFASL